MVVEADHADVLGHPAARAGTHTLSLRASRDGSSLPPNADITLDRLALVDVSDGAPEEYPASTMRQNGGASTGADGGVRLGNGVRADIYVTAMETGYHDLTTTWRDSRAGRVDLAVNGRSAAALTSPTDGTWTSTVRVFLSRGINEVELTSPSSASVLSLGTVRAAAEDEAAVRLQAEAQPLGGTATIRTYADATGSNVDGGFVGNVGHGEGNCVEIPRGAGFDSPGAYELEVEYANAELSGQHSYNPQVVDRRLDVAEAGRDGLAGYAYFRYTYAWESFAERTIPLDLATPDAPLRLFNASAWAPDIDAVTIAPLTTGEVVTVAAPRRR
jgi:hypothetical protein